MSTSSSGNRTYTSSVQGVHWTHSITCLLRPFPTTAEFPPNPSGIGYGSSSNSLSSRLMAESYSRRYEGGTTASADEGVPGGSEGGCRAPSAAEVSAEDVDDRARVRRGRRRRHAPLLMVLVLMLAALLLLLLLLLVMAFTLVPRLLLRLLLLRLPLVLLRRLPGAGGAGRKADTFGGVGAGRATATATAGKRNRRGGRGSTIMAIDGQ